MLKTLVMNFEIFDVRALLFGILGGIICVGGLFFGMSAILKSTRDDLQLSASQRKKLKAFGIILVVGQVFLAFGTLWYYMSNTEQPAVLPLAFGLVTSIFIGNFIFNAMRK